MDISMGERAGSVEPGDQVMVRGWWTRVERVVIHAPGQHPTDAPIVPTMYAVQAITHLGSRWAGGTTAHIGADLRAHWER